jgi:hypothetical protein
MIQPFSRVVQILEGAASELMLELQARDARVDFTHADPPWPFGKAAPPKHGRMDGHYEGMTYEAIVDDLDNAYDLALDDTYLTVWCTFPHVFPFAFAWWKAGVRWEPLTGGTWGKPGRGIGFHMIGDSEPLFVFKKGNPRPRTAAKSNLWEIEPYWREQKRGHSEKPQAILADLLELSTRRGDLVLDLYAGETASLARQCALRRRGYVGAEIDRARCNKARELLEAVVDEA